MNLLIDTSCGQIAYLVIAAAITLNDSDCQGTWRHLCFSTEDSSVLIVSAKFYCLMCSEVQYLLGTWHWFVKHACYPLRQGKPQFEVNANSGGVSSSFLNTSITYMASRNSPESLERKNLKNIKEQLTFCFNWG